MSIQSEEAQLSQLVIHFCGNASQDEALQLSKKETKPATEVRELLKIYFLQAFRNPIYYQFDTSIQGGNPTFDIVQEIFAKKEKFLSESKRLAELLYNCSAHPKIKSGEFYLVRFEQLICEGESVDAIGIFKSENREKYLKIYKEEESYHAGTEEGINIYKLDKGCLVLNTEQEQGYRVCLLDSPGKSEEARYWKDHFLGLKPRSDNYFKTKNVMELTRDFCKQVLVEENNVSPVDRMQVMNDSARYFAEQPSFNMSEFEKEVFQEPAVIEAFHDYKRNYEPLKMMSAPLDEFDISAEAVKGGKKFFKHVLKLDKNFHLYIHGNADMIERGYDEQRGMKYYKLYYNNETQPG